MGVVGADVEVATLVVPRSSDAVPKSRQFYPSSEES
jgi:hypothetical protein